MISLLHLVVPQPGGFLLVFTCPHLQMLLPRESEHLTVSLWSSSTESPNTQAPSGIAVLIPLELTPAMICLPFFSQG